MTYDEYKSLRELSDAIGYEANNLHRLGAPQILIDRLVELQVEVDRPLERLYDDQYD